MTFEVGQHELIFVGENEEKKSLKVTAVLVDGEIILKKALSFILNMIILKI